jgi:hypothetical protein
MKHYDPPVKHPHPRAKTPEDEVEPLADPETEAPPPVHDPDDDEPDEKAAREIIGEIPPGPEPEPIPVPVPGAFALGGPHHS